MNISHNEIALSIELLLFIIVEDQIKYAIDLCQEVMENVFSFAEIVQVGEMHP